MHQEVESPRACVGLQMSSSKIQDVKLMWHRLNDVHNDYVAWQLGIHGKHPIVSVTGVTLHGFSLIMLLPNLIHLSISV